MHIFYIISTCEGINLYNQLLLHLLSSRMNPFCRNLSLFLPIWALSATSLIPVSEEMPPSSKNVSMLPLLAVLLPVHGLFPSSWSSALLVIQRERPLLSSGVAASSTTTAGTTTPSATASPSRPALCSPCWCSNSGLLVVCTYGWHKNDKLSSHCIFVFNTFNIEKLKKKWRKAICMHQYFFPSQILKFAIKLVIRKG